MTRTDHRRPSAVVALAASLAALALLLLAPGALARTGHSGTGTCPSAKSSRHTRHAARHHCAKHGTSHRSHSRHHTTGTTHSATRKKTAAPIALIPATCEDETLPTRAADGSYSCDDGSEPSCEDGVGAGLSATTGQPMCLPPAEATLDAGTLACPEGEGECDSEEVLCETEGSESSAPQCEVVSEETGEESGS